MNKKRKQKEIKARPKEIPLFKKISSDFRFALIAEDKLHLPGLGLIILIAVIVRLFYLFQPIRYDEAYTFFVFAKPPLNEGLTLYNVPNNHIFHTLLAHIFYSILGSHPWVLRLPAFIAGILVIPAAYIMIRRLYNKNAALISAGLVSSSSFLVEYSTNARGYTLICLFSLLLATLASYLYESKSLTGWLLFAVISALGFYTIPIMLYPFGIIIAWLILTVFLHKPENKNLILICLFISLVSAALMTLFLYAPVINRNGLEALTANRFITERSGWEYFRGHIKSSLTLIWRQWNRDIPAAIKYTLLMAFFTSLIFHKKISKFKIPLPAAAVLWLGTILTLRPTVPFERSWLFLLPFYLSLSGAGICFLLSLPKINIPKYDLAAYVIFPVLLSAGLAVGVIRDKSVYLSNETGTLRSAENYTLFLKDYLRPQDKLIALCPSDMPMLYYFDLYNLPLNYILGPATSDNRFLVIVNEREEQTLDKILDRTGLKKAGFVNSKEIKRDEFSALYEVSR